MDAELDMADSDRVAAYLDDQLQTAADLETGNLDALLARITEQQGLLKQQVDAAQKDLHDAKHGAHAHHAQLQQQAHTFRRQQAVCWSSRPATRPRRPSRASKRPSTSCTASTSQVAMSSCWPKSTCSGRTTIDSAMPAVG
jgi:hypothetical protein